MTELGKGAGPLRRGALLCHSKVTCRSAVSVVSATTGASATTLVETVASTLKTISAAHPVPAVAAVTAATALRSLIGTDLEGTARDLSIVDAVGGLGGELSDDLHKGEGRVDVNLAQVRAAQAALTCDSSDDGAGLDAVTVADLDTVASSA